ncbi:MAG: GntR family transcriptional regulator [Paludibaculum sp.]
MSKSEPFRFRLDNATGVPVYRQLIDQVQLAIASGAMLGGDQLPTVRQVAVDLAINPNTVMRAYRELEIRGTLTTQQGLGTFVSLTRVEQDQVQRDARLSRLAAECATRAGSEGFSVRDLIGRLADLVPESESEG